jgi:uncharacterized phage-associated protein
MSINKCKYKNVILYLTEKSGGSIQGKKKLAKLLYYVDFDSFEKNEVAITLDTYKAYPMGPLPQKMEEVLSEMSVEGTLDIKKVDMGSGYNPVEIYSSKSKADASVFDAEEIFILDRVIKKYSSLNGKQLENLSHAEAPYIGTNPMKEITYELAFYRDTDFENE